MQEFKYDYNYNIKAKKDMTYDAIVIGSGMSGGWAAKELCEAGLKTLVLERGRIVQHLKDYPDMNKDCLLYTSPSPRDRTRSRMPSSA